MEKECGKMREFKNRRNPILPLEFHIPDSEAHVMPDGKLYLYGSFDDREDVYCSDRYRVVVVQRPGCAEISRHRLDTSDSVYPEDVGKYGGRRRGYERAV